MTDYLQEFLPDLEEFRTKTMQFHNKELTVPQYKGFSGGFGSYAQKGGMKHMLRLRMAGGRLTKERMAAIVDVIDHYDIPRLKLTTCQSIQMHDLEAETLCNIIEPIWMGGMISRGGGGDFPRNVMTSPLSGVEVGEYFDVLPYAEAAGEYMMQFIKAVKFPRKLKVCFSNGPANVVHATIRDLGFVANEDGTFDVYAAGGMGNNPRLGLKVADHIAPAKILYYIKAMVNTFVAYGNYENRGKARTRYMQETLGEEGFVKAYQEKLAQVLAEEQLDLTIEAAPVTKTGTPAADDSFLSDRRITAEKQQGLYAVKYQPIGGQMAPAKLKEIYETIKDMDAVEVRITPSEGLYVINCNEDEAKKVLAVTEDGAKNLFETSLACIGNPTCQQGLGDSQSLLKLCVSEMRKYDFADGVLPRIQISGCPSSCTGHQVAPIGFRGAMKRTEAGMVPAFAIFVGGNDRQGCEKLAEAGTIMAVTDIPKFLGELGTAVAAAGTTYEKWIPDHADDLTALIAKFA